MRVHARNNTCNTGCNALQSVQHVLPCALQSVQHGLQRVAVGATRATRPVFGAVLGVQQVLRRKHSLLVLCNTSKKLQGARKWLI